MEGELAADEVELDVPVRVEVLYPLLGAVGGVELPREQPVIIIIIRLHIPSDRTTVLFTGYNYYYYYYQTTYFQ